MDIALVMRWVRDLWRMMRGKPLGCDHRWQKIKFGVRQCERCGRRQYMTVPKYPQAHWR